MIKTIEIKELFKLCCFHNNHKVYLDELKTGHNQQLNANIDFVEKNTRITNICGWCNTKIKDGEFDYLASYWTPFIWKPVHASCKKEYKNTESLKCQTIDANCNDCLFFERGEIKSEFLEEHNTLGLRFDLNWQELRSWSSSIDGKQVVIEKMLSLRRMAKVGDEVNFNGFCKFINIPVQAYSNFATGYKCFKHRKTI
jgi:hypothetical protein